MRPQDVRVTIRQPNRQWECSPWLYVSTPPLIERVIHGTTPYSNQIRQWLLAEMEAWRVGGILADDQPGAVLDLYETPLEGRTQTLAGHVRLSSVAALMIGLAALWW